MIAHRGFVIAHRGFVIAHRRDVMAESVMSHWGTVVAYLGVVFHWEDAMAPKGGVVANWKDVVSYLGSCGGAL